MKTIFLILILVAAAMVAVLMAEEFNNQLSLQWPPAYCRSSKCNMAAKKLRDFKLHGLWPYTPEKKCKGNRYEYVEFNIELHKQVHKKLKTEWPTLKAEESNMEFWVHEWKSHGRCTLPLMTVMQYFERTLHLFEQLEPRTILNGADILVGQQYTVQELTEKLPNLRYKPAIICTTETSTGTVLLTELRFCINPQGTIIEECASARLMGCGGSESGKKILFPN